MKQTIKLITLIAVLQILVVGPSAADTDVTFKAQVRARTEFDAKDFNSHTAGKLFTLQRTRVGMQLKTSENVLAFVQIQDSRVWGIETSTVGDASADQFDLHQGFFKVSKLFDRPLTIKAGRMELAYGNQRLVGSVGWSNTGRSFDGVVLKIHPESFNVDVFATNVRDSSTLMSAGAKDTDRYFFGAYGTFDWNAGDNKSEVYFLYDLDRDTIPSGTDEGKNLLQRGTLGAAHNVKHQGFGATLEGAFQFGTMGTKSTVSVTHFDISSYFFAVNAGYEFTDVAWKPWIGAGVDWLSGDDDVTDSDFKAFNTLFATNHKWYGYMDYFPSFSGVLGLRDFIVKARVQPRENGQIAVTYHNFQRDQEDTAGNTAFGHEIDTQVKCTHSKHLTLQAGYSIFLRGDILDTSSTPDDAHWFYLMAVANL